MKIEEVRKIMAAQPTGFRVAYLTNNDLLSREVSSRPFNLTPELDQDPLPEQEAHDIAITMASDPRFKPYGIVRTWVVEA
jgi:hypothetical protein